MVSFLKPAFDSICMAVTGFWSDVCVPFWNSLVQWTNGYMPWVKRLADFCFELFRFRYKARVYSYAALMPIVLIVLLATIIRKKRRRKRRERCNKAKTAASQAGRG